MLRIFREGNLREVAHDVAKMAEELGFIDQQKYRNYQIWEEYKELKDEGVTCEEAEEQLSVKWRLSASRVHNIYYEVEKRKE